nr:APETALA2-like protein 1 [Aegilops tauschii subsp. strangulata]
MPPSWFWRSSARGKRPSARWFWRFSARERFARAPLTALVRKKAHPPHCPPPHSRRLRAIMSIRHLGASDFRGVRERRSGTFSSKIWFCEKRLILGTFDTAEEAARAHDAAAWRFLRPRRDMNFLNVSSQRAQDLAPLPRLFTDEDRRVHRRRQRRLAIAEKDVEALVVWRGGFPQDIVD